jgi:hypothetical protein
MQAMLTSMIFERALKMRLKADISTGDDPTELDRIDMGSDAQKEQKPPSAALAGLFTDLVTSDLDNLQSGNEFVGSRTLCLPFCLVLCPLPSVFQWSTRL